MSDEKPAQSEAPAENTTSPSPEDSLSTIAKEFTVEEHAKQFTATPQTQQQQPSQPYQGQYVPDPVVDQEGYKHWAMQQYQRSQQYESSMRDLSSKLTAIEQRFQQQEVDADVGRAVKTVNQKLKVDDDLAEALLNIEYNKNPSFKHIWDNRKKNPGAFDKALNVLSDKLYSKVQVRQDPQLAENVRAAQSSQRTMATTKQPNQTEEWDGLSPREFDEKWRAMIARG